MMDVVGSRLGLGTTIIKTYLVAASRNWNLQALYLCEEEKTSFKWVPRPQDADLITKLRKIEITANVPVSFCQILPERVTPDETFVTRKAADITDDRAHEENYLLCHNETGDDKSCGVGLEPEVNMLVSNYMTALLSKTSVYIYSTERVQDGNIKLAVVYKL
jgi:hypothetical protein